MSTLRFDRWLDSNGVPMGTVIYMASAGYVPTDYSYVAVSDGVKYNTDLSLTYTPLYANSVLYIHATTQIRAQNANGMTAGIRRNPGTGTFSDIVYGNGNDYRNFHMDFFYKGGTVNHHNNMQMRCVVPALNTSANVFNVWISPWSDTGEWSRSWGQHYIQLWEIQQ
jgi:hypothetical protein